MISVFPGIARSVFCLQVMHVLIASQLDTNLRSVAKRYGTPKTSFRRNCHCGSCYE